MSLQQNPAKHLFRNMHPAKKNQARAMDILWLICQSMMNILSSYFCKLKLRLQIKAPTYFQYNIYSWHKLISLLFLLYSVATTTAHHNFINLAIHSLDTADNAENLRSYATRQDFLLRCTFKFQTLDIIYFPFYHNYVICFNIKNFCLLR